MKLNKWKANKQEVDHVRALRDDLVKVDEKHFGEKYYFSGKDGVVCLCAIGHETRLLKEETIEDAQGYLDRLTDLDHAVSYSPRYYGGGSVIRRLSGYFLKNNITVNVDSVQVTDIADVNNLKSDRYPQASIKERVINCLNDMLESVEVVAC